MVGRTHRCRVVRIIGRPPGSRQDNAVLISQVAASASALSQGTTEQAASVQETTASLEQMSASITQNGENSREMERMALRA
jgi:methyl-accepting chemotaxis protein